MFGQLLLKECRQTSKSVIYWLTAAILVLFFFSQLGSTHIAEKPTPGKKDYGMVQGGSKKQIMEASLGTLASEYISGSYATYPIGFYKNVRVNKEEEKRIGEILAEATGLTSKNEITKLLDKQIPKDPLDIYQSIIIAPAKGLTYNHFKELMKEMDTILGGSSNYAKEKLESNVTAPKTYEQALEEYEELTKKDYLTGGYARLFCDYMGVMLGILPVFLAVTRGMRDKRANMQALIASRKASSAVIIGSRYVSILIMMMLPVLLLSCLMLKDCIQTAAVSKVAIDYFAFLKYSFAWLLPTIMIVTAIGMVLTELTETALGILVQVIIWFVSLFASMPAMMGGMYGWSLIPRHNTIYEYDLFQKGFEQLAANRIFYTVLSVVLVAASTFIYSLKRKGRLDVHGKILGNLKRKHKA